MLKSGVWGLVIVLKLAFKALSRTAAGVIGPSADRPARNSPQSVLGQKMGAGTEPGKTNPAGKCGPVCPPLVSFLEDHSVSKFRPDRGTGVAPGRMFPTGPRAPGLPSVCWPASNHLSAESVKQHHGRRVRKSPHAFGARQSLPLGTSATPTPPGRLSSVSFLPTARPCAWQGIGKTRAS